MRWAIISDIHANIEALDAVMADIERRQVDSILCLGDVIGYGPEPREALKRALEWDQVLLGNHEEACMYHAGDFNERARVALEWTRDQLNSRDHSPEENSELWTFLAGMPSSVTVDSGLLVHGSPRDPVREYMLPTDARDQTKMREVFAGFEGRFCFVGHSHVPGVYTQQNTFLAPNRLSEGMSVSQGKVVVNVGSVGQPRDGDNRASYVTWDGERVLFHRVVYDYRTTQRKIVDTGVLPHYLAKRLKEGR